MPQKPQRPLVVLGLLHRTVRFAVDAAEDHGEDADGRLRASVYRDRRNSWTSCRFNLSVMPSCASRIGGGTLSSCSGRVIKVVRISGKNCATTSGTGKAFTRNSPPPRTEDAFPGCSSIATMFACSPRSESSVAAAQKPPWLSNEHRKLLLELTRVAPGDWVMAPEQREFISKGDGLRLSLYLSSSDRFILCVEWQADEVAGKKLAADVRRTLQARTSRKWRLGQKSWNRIYIE